VTASGYFDLVTRILGASIALASVQWMIAILRLRLDLLLGWSPTHRLVSLGILGSRAVAGLCLLALYSPSFATGVALPFAIAADVFLWAAMRPALHAVFRMTHILTGLFLVAHLPADNVAEAALFTIAGVVSLSYLVTGATKLVSPGWYDGATLLVALRSRTNGHRRVALWAEEHRGLLAAAAWSVILFECLFPLALVTGTTGAGVFLTLGVSFHLGIAVIMGMNLFPLAWFATYPAIWFAAANRDRLFSLPWGSSPLLTGLMVWFAVLVAWQFLAGVPWMQRRRPGTFERRCERGFHFFLYEFYMFAIRTPDIGFRYRVQGAGAAWKPLPLPWERRLRDAFWNPEHELKKTVRTLATRIRAAGGKDDRIFRQIGDWQRVAEKYPEGTKFEYRLVEDDAFATEASPLAVEERAG
jgi:hypothetical protein